MNRMEGGVNPQETTDPEKDLVLTGRNTLSFIGRM